MIEENGKITFQKKDYVYTDTLGVCRVEEVTNLATKNGPITQYYGLRSMQHETTTAYYPVEGHEVTIRPLISEEEAKKLVEKIQELKNKENITDEEKIDEKLVFEAKFAVDLAEKIRQKKASKK